MGIVFILVSLKKGQLRTWIPFVFLISCASIFLHLPDVYPDIRSELNLVRFFLYTFGILMMIVSVITDYSKIFDIKRKRKLILYTLLFLTPSLSFIPILSVFMQLHVVMMVLLIFALGLYVRIYLYKETPTHIFLIFTLIFGFAGVFTSFISLLFNAQFIWDLSYVVNIMWITFLLMTAIVAFIEDRIKNSEKELNNLKLAEEKLKEVIMIKSEMFVRSSHELKTPIVSIKGFSDLLLTVHRSKLDDYSIAKITAIKKGADRLQKIIGDILKAAELESGHTKIILKNDNLSNIIHICAREVQDFADLRNHELEINVQPKLITNFEEEQIHKVVINLLSNAIKYTPPSGKIEIKSEIRNNLIITSIIDNGIGFTSEEKQKIFKQFGKIERYGQNLGVVPDGSGLGLFISKKIIELHGGEIWVESEGRNQGSAFYFTLPTAK